MSNQVPPYPIYGSTFSLYRMSPLCHGSGPLFQETSLETHARRLRDLLKGDIFRGMEITLSGALGTITSVGPLEGCTWELFGDELWWTKRHSRESTSPSKGNTPSSTPLSSFSTRGIHIQLRYPSATYRAFLLHDPTRKFGGSPEFTHLPLLLLRMPSHVRDVVLKYITSAFDTHISSLRLHSSFLASSLEQLLYDLTSDNSTQSIESVIKGLQIQLTFPNVTPLLKNIDITISRDEVPAFLSRGRALYSQRDRQLSLSQSQHSFTSNLGPFMIALTHYLSTQLALTSNPYRPSLHISKIACAFFALSTDGKMKLFPPQPLDLTDSHENPPQDSATQLAMLHFCDALVREAERSLSDELAHLTIQETNLNLESTAHAPKRTTGKRPVGQLSRLDAQILGVKRRRAGGDIDDVSVARAEASSAPATPLQVPADPPPPYELHDPARIV